MRKTFDLLFLLVLLLPFPIFFVHAQTSLPTLDGVVKKGEWSGAYQYTIPLTNSENLNLSIIYTSKWIYFLALIPHNKPGDVIRLDPSGLHDYFGIEFDRNGDHKIHGTKQSPDDMVLVNYFRTESQDFYTHSFKVFNDTANGGIENTMGTVGVLNGTLVFEFAKQMNSGDTKGYDIALHSGDSYAVMFGFWDDQPTHSPNVVLNKPIGGDYFLTFTVGSFRDTSSNLLGFILSGIIVVLTAGILVYFKKFRK